MVCRAVLCYAVMLDCGVVCVVMQSAVLCSVFSVVLCIAMWGVRLCVSCRCYWFVAWCCVIVLCYYIVVSCVREFYVHFISATSLCPCVKAAVLTVTIYLFIYFLLSSQQHTTVWVKPILWNIGHVRCVTPVSLSWRSQSPKAERFTKSTRISTSALRPASDDSFLSRKIKNLFPACLNKYDSSVAKDNFIP